MSKKDQNTHFICVVCNQNVLPLQNGSYRNHCPFCLMSLHVDNKPGDRASGCGGIMMPWRVTYNGSKGWQIRHKCERCGRQKANKIADGAVQPDNWDMVIELSENVL